MKTQRFKIGLQFMPMGLKHPKLETIVDVLRTYNSNNELVELYYVTEHDFFGQKVRRGMVTDTHIARSLDAEGRLKEVLEQAIT